MPTHINPDSLYTRTDLQNLFSPLGVNADTVVARIRPRKVFRQFFLGSDLLAALREAPALGEEKDLPGPKNSGNRKGKTKIAGMFDPDEVGL
jgi:hypothetical protein